MLSLFWIPLSIIKQHSCLGILNNISEKKIIGIGILFSLLNISFILTEQYWGLFIPFGIALFAALILSLDKVLLFLIFSTPLSIFYFNEDMNLGFNLPTEPILFGILLLFIFKTLHQGSFDLKFLKHPLTIVFLANLLWMVVTTITSEMPFISFKYTLARTWFLAGFYFMMSQLLRKNFRTKKLFFWMYLIPFCLVIIYITYLSIIFVRESFIIIIFGE